MHSHTPLLPQGPLQCQVMPGPGETFCWQLLEIAEVSREKEKVEVTWLARQNWLILQLGERESKLGESWRGLTALFLQWL